MPVDIAPAKASLQSPWNFSGIKTPRMVALVCGVGTGSKLLQAMLDNHEQIYMVPAYPLMYFYPHWQTWQKELRDKLTWETLIDIFCIKHASVLDSRKIPGHNGLTSLGANANEHIEIDETLFRETMTTLLGRQPICSRTFLLALHYAFAICRKEDLSKKRILIYHIHMVEYLNDFLIQDFPDALTIAMLRDQRSNIERRINAAWNVDDAKLNRSDALIYRRRAYYQICSRILNDINALEHLPSQNVRLIKHEDLHFRRDEVLSSLCDYLGIDNLASNREITFGGKTWGGDKVYNMPHLNRVNPRVVSLDWQKKIGTVTWFILEGVLFDYCQHYGYGLYKYRRDHPGNKILLLLAVLLPNKFEWQALKLYLKPGNHIDFLRTCWAECRPGVQLTDYTWNATHLYKWTYLDLKLWQPRWFRNIHLKSMLLFSAGVFPWLEKPAFLPARMAYVAANILRYWWALISFPVVVVRRIRLCYAYLFRRWRQRNFFAQAI